MKPITIEDRSARETLSEWVWESSDREKIVDKISVDAANTVIDQIKADTDAYVSTEGDGVTELTIKLWDDGSVSL